MKDLIVKSIFIIFFFTVSFTCFAQETDLSRKDLTLAVQYFSDGLYDDSIQALEKFIQTYPNDQLIDTANLYLAKSYYFKKDYPQSTVILTGLLAKPGVKVLDEVYYWLAEISLQSKDYQDCFFYASKVINEYKQSRFIWAAKVLAAQVNYHMDKFEEAKTMWLGVALTSTDPDAKQKAYSRLFDVYLELKDMFGLKAISQRYLEDSPRGIQAAKAYFNLAEISRADKQYDQAVSLYNKALGLSSHENQTDSILQALGTALLEKGDFVKSRNTFARINDPVARGYLNAVYFMRIGDFTQAVEIFDIFVKNFPDSALAVQAFLYKADALYQLGRINDAVYLYQYIIRTFNQQKYLGIIGRSHYGLAWCYRRLNESQKSLDEFTASLEFLDDPILRANVDLQLADIKMANQQYQDALNGYKQVLANPQGSNYDVYARFQAGVSCVYLQKWDEAISYLKPVLKDTVYGNPAIYYLAAAYVAIGDDDSAEPLLNNFLHNSQDNDLVLTARYNLGKCYLNKQQYKSAVELLQPVSQRGQGRIKEAAMLDLAAAWFSLGDLAQAQKVWQDFLEMFSLSAYVGKVALSLGQIKQQAQEYDQAIKYYQIAADAQIDPESLVQAKFFLGDLYYKQGDLEQAEKYLVQIVNHDQLNVDAGFILAQIKIDQDKKIEAVEIYDLLIAKNILSVSYQAQLQKAYVLKDLKQYPQAIDSFVAANNITALKSKDLFNSAMCYEKQGLWRKAIDQYLTIVQRNDDPDYEVKARFRAAKIHEDLMEFTQAKALYTIISATDCPESNIAKQRLSQMQTHFSQKTR